MKKKNLKKNFEKKKKKNLIKNFEKKKNFLNIYIYYV